MNERKFLFVTCVNNDLLYSSCLKYIQNLIVPSGYQVELFPIRGIQSIFEGYNMALKNDAKYKIYLHQDTFIINKNFLQDILTIFQSNPSLGLLGLAGCKNLPRNGIWWQGTGLVGKVIGLPNGTYALQNFGEVNGLFEPVQAVDGFLMVTQYDIPWRSDLFKGFHFYDISQSKEFTRRRYLVGVANQREPWCIHYHLQHNQTFKLSDYMAVQKTFIQHYSS